MNSYILLLLIIIMCISLSQSYEKHSKHSGKSGSKGAVSLASSKNSKKLRKVRVKKRKDKQNETENQQTSKITDQKAFRRKRVEQNSPKLRKKHKKTITIANDQPMGKYNMPTKRGKVTGKLVKRRKRRKRIKAEQNLHGNNDKRRNLVNDQQSDEKTTAKTLQSVQRPGKRNMLKHELVSNNQEKTEKVAKRRKQKKKRRRKQRGLVKPDMRKNSRSRNLDKKIHIVKAAPKRWESTKDKKFIDLTNRTFVSLKNQDPKVKIPRRTRKKIRKKKIRTETSVKSKVTTIATTGAPKIVSTNKPVVLTILDDFKKVPIFDPNNTRVIPLFNFTRKKVTGRKVKARDGATLIVDESGMYHWGENYSHAGYSEFDYYRYMKQKLEQEERERRLGKPYLAVKDLSEDDPETFEYICREILPDGRCKYLIDSKCLEKFHNGECAKKLEYHMVEDWKTGKKERLPPEEVTYPPPPSKKEILKMEKEIYYKSHCILNSKQCVFLYDIANKEPGAVEGILNLHKRRMSLVGRRTSQSYNEDTNERKAEYLLGELLSENEDHSCQFVASVFPSVKMYLVKYAESCQF